MPTGLDPRLIEAPGGGLVRNADPRHVQDRQWSNGRNIRFPTGGTRVRKTDGFSRMEDSGAPMEPLRAIWWYVPTSGEGAQLVRIGVTGAWAGSGETLTRIATFTQRSLHDVITIDQFLDSLIWTDGIEVWEWNGAEEATPLADTSPGAPVSGLAPVGALVEIHKERVLLGRLPNQPWMLSYSYPRNVHDWTTEGAGDQDFLEDSTGLTAIKVLGDHAIIHKPNRLYRFISVGPPDIYVAEGIPGDDGALSARSPISVGSYQYYLGRHNFYRLGSFSEAIGDSVWPDVADAIDWPRAHLAYAYRRLEFDEVCWKIPTRGSDQPNLTAVFNDRDQTWTLTDHDRGTCFAEMPPPGTSEGQDPGETHRPPVLSAFGTASGLIQIYGGTDADGVPVYSWVESRHFTDGLIPVKVLAAPIYATGTGNLNVTVRAAMDPRMPMPPWKPPRQLPLDPQRYRPWVDVREYGRLWQVRLESNQMGDDWEVAAYGAAVIPGGFAR